MLEPYSAKQFSAKEIVVSATTDHSGIAKVRKGQGGIFPHIRAAIRKALTPTVQISRAEHLDSNEPHNSVRLKSFLGVCSNEITQLLIYCDVRQQPYLTKYTIRILPMLATSPSRGSINGSNCTVLQKGIVLITLPLSSSFAAHPLQYTLHSQECQPHQLSLIHI